MTATKRLVVATLAAVVCGGASAAGKIVLDRETACGLVWTLGHRVALMQTISRLTESKAMAGLSGDQQASLDAATKELIELTRSNCKVMSGAFQVLERRTYDGWNATRFATGPNDYLWVAR